MANQITELRRSGRTDEGIALGRSLIEAGQADQWDYNALFWCYYDRLRAMNYTDSDRSVVSEILQEMENLLSRMPQNSEVAVEQLDRLKRWIAPGYAIVANALQLSKTAGREVEAYTMVTPIMDSSSNELHEDIGWILFRYLKANVQTLNSIEVRRILAKYMSLNNPRPSLLHSMILQMALSFAKQHSDFIFYRFFQLWGPQNLRVEDYLDNTQNGTTYPSMVKRIISQMFTRECPFTPKDVYEMLDSRRITLTMVVEECRSACFWNIYNLSRLGKSFELWNSFDSYVATMSEYGPSEAHSKILSLAAYAMSETDQYRFISFFLTWGVDNLRYEDWVKEVGRDGREYDSKAAQVLKKVYEIIKSNIDQSRIYINDLLPVFKIGSEKLNDDHWPKYRYAKILLWSGQRQEARTILKLIASELSSQSYFWKDLSETEDAIDCAIALKIKAISLQPEEVYLKTDRVELAKLLINVGKPELAHIELSKYESYRRSVNKDLDSSYYPLWNQVQSFVGTEEEYAAYCLEKQQQAEEILFEDLPWERFAIYDIWKTDDGKEKFTLLDQSGKTLTISRRRFKDIRNARHGAIVELRLDVSDSRDRRLPVMARLTDLEKWSIFPKKYGYVVHRTEEEKVYIYCPDQIDAIKSAKANERIVVGKYVMFRQISKIHNGNVLKEAKGVWIIPNSEGLEQFPSASVVIDNVNQERRLYHYVSDTGVDGILKMEDTTSSFKVGNCLEIKYYLKKDRRGRKTTCILKLRKIQQCTDTLVKNIEGRISFPCSGDGYGFVGDYYVPRNLAVEYNEGEMVYGRAVYTGNRKWKVFELSR